MKTVLALLSSLKLAVTLLVLVLVALAAGTIVETRAGADAAAEWVYYAPWFLALEALFAVNATASIVALFPWGRARLGYLVTHGSLVLVLAGALVTSFFKVEGTLGLWEGTSGNIIEHVERGELVARHALPFSVKLLDFQIDRYPGTMRPAMFRSRVEITDPAAGARYPADIWMNHPLEVQGYRIFQSSYQQQGGREASIFSVSKDPGQPLVFAGYGLLVLGMCMVLGTRIAGRRRGARAAEPRAVVRASAALLAAVIAGSASAASPAEVEVLRRLPVQHDGRTMPLDTYAREAVWHVTGARTWQGQDPAATLAGWLSDPRQASFSPVIAIGSDELAAAIGAPGADHLAFTQLLDNAGFGRLVSQARAAEARGEPRRGLAADAEKLLERAGWMQEIVQGQAIRPVPAAGDPSARWGVPSPPALAGFLALVQGPRPSGWPGPQAIDREITYNRVRPTRLAWIVLALALILSVIAGWRARPRALDLAAAGLLVAGLAAMTWAIGMRWAVAGWVPANNMYESLLILGWGVGLFAVVAYAFIQNRLLVLVASAGAALTMALTDLLPIDGFIHPPPPVLRDTIWLGIHVPVIMVGYAVLALGVVVSHLQIAFSALAPRREEAIERMADLNYWFMFVGSIFLIAGILTGSVWAASSWGRYWGWDPKEVWSLVAWLAYMAILHGRVDKVLGRFGVAAISIAAFQTILMTYLGVNYVLGTGMHSYGFGDSPVLRWMVIVAAAEGAFLVWGWAAQRRRAAAA